MTAPFAAEDRVFNAPWEAQAFGAFSWNEWTDALAGVIAEARKRGDDDTGADYYRQWLIALERIAVRKGLVDDAALERRRQQWEEAADRTPHGQPIELNRHEVSD